MPAQIAFMVLAASLTLSLYLVPSLWRRNETVYMLGCLLWAASVIAAVVSFVGIR